MLDDRVKIENRLDDAGNPAGGSVKGVGVDIEWQNGPLGRGDDRQEPNGAFVETVIHSAAERIRFYQNGKFNCETNAKALIFLEAALEQLHKRTAERETREVEGTHEQ